MRNELCGNLWSRLNSRFSSLKRLVPFAKNESGHNLLEAGIALGAAGMGWLAIVFHLAGVHHH
jgi:hypothetical protein